MSGPDPGIHLDSEFPPRRGLKLWEKYELVLAIHRAYASAPPIKRRENRTYWRKRGTGDLVDSEIYQWSLCVPRLSDDHFGQVQRVVGVVCTDLEVKPPRLTRPATGPAIVNITDASTRNVVVIAGDGQGKKPTGPKRKRLGKRGKVKVLTGRQEAVVAALEDFNLSVAKVAETRHCTDKAVYALYKRAKENPGYKNRRSVNLNAAKPLHANTLPKGGERDDQ